jgi:hypothetical protein
MDATTRARSGAAAGRPRRPANAYNAVAHLATLLRPGGCLNLVDAAGTARGDDNAAGLRLAERLARAGLELVEFRGRYVIRELSPGLRSPGA